MTKGVYYYDYDAHRILPGIHTSMRGNLDNVYGNCGMVSGDVSGLTGNLTHIAGCATGVFGDLCSIKFDDIVFELTNVPTKDIS